MCKYTSNHVWKEPKLADQRHVKIQSILEVTDTKKKTNPPQKTQKYFKGNTKTHLNNPIGMLLSQSQQDPVEFLLWLAHN